MKIIRYIKDLSEVNILLDELTRPIKYIVLHCTAGPQTQKVENILAYWVKLGWKSPGYHFMIAPDGSVAYLQSLNKASNGVKGFNAYSINISYIGGVVTDDKDPENAKGSPIDNRTTAQRRAMKMLVEVISTRCNDAIIQGHRDFSPDKNRNGIIEKDEWIKTCPSFSVAQWLREIGFKSKLPKILMTTTGVNIRTGPGLEYPQAAPALNRNTVVRYLGVDGEWSYVSVEGENIKGFVNSRYLRG